MNDHSFYLTRLSIIFRVGAIHGLPLLMIKVAKTSEIPLNAGKIVQVSNEVIAVFNVDGKFCAVDNSCPHRGGPLGEGDLNGSVVTCPWHSWQFDVATGECPDIPGEKLKTYPCVVEGEDILIEI